MKRHGTEYTKPYATEIFGQRRVTHYAYPREELMGEDIFPYLVLDGGASQLMLDRFGSNSGERMLELTMSGELFHEFQNGGEYNWERSFAYTDGTGFRKKYEWQIWPQRLYMTIPVAHAFLRTGEERYARRWLEIVRGWADAHPYQPFDPEVHYLKTDMVWRDMQVAWRTMSLLHGLFMLEDAPFSREEWEYLYALLATHTSHLYEEAEDRIRRGLAQNHVLQIGVVLIMAAVMFPELPRAEELLAIGTDTVKMNMRAIYPDGASDEDSPSYGHFIVRLYLEAYLLLKNNGIEPPAGLRESIVKQYEWLYNFATPAGRTARISDSYGMDALADLARAERLLQIDFPRERTSRHFRESKTAVLRCGDITLYADAMDYRGGHHHGARPELLLFYGNEPIIVDGGCCSYDRWELYWHLRDPRTHSILFTPEFSYPDGGIDMTSEITEFDPSGIIAFSIRVREGEDGYEWQRRIAIAEDAVTITDRVTASREMAWESRILTARADVHQPSESRIERLTHGVHTEIESSRPMSTSLIPVMNDENKIDYAIAVISKGHGACFELETTLKFTKR